MSDETVSAFEFEGWAILELMGHRKMGGYVRMNGPLIRIDVADEKAAVMTQWYGAHSLYCLTPTTEAVAKRLTQSAYRPAPVTKYELQLPAPPVQRTASDDLAEREFDPGDDAGDDDEF